MKELLSLNLSVWVESDYILQIKATTATSNDKHECVFEVFEMF